MKCRHCGSGLSLSFLDLGSAPPSNAYLDAADLNKPEIWLPLRVLTCRSCWLVQTEDVIRHDALFTSDYAYFSSVSSSWLAHAEAFAAEAASRFGLTARSLVCEVAANDGYLLQFFRRAGIPCYGVEPTTAAATVARAAGLDIVEDFFGVELARTLSDRGRQADLVIANNVLAHVPDIGDFVRGIRDLLKPHGVASFEFPHLLSMVDGNQFDTVYHEHFSYLSATALNRVFAANGLTMIDAAELPTHGGSLRIFARRAGADGPEASPAVSRLLAREAEAGIETPGFYSGFQSRADAIKLDLVEFLLATKRAGRRVGAYGAAAKGNTLLNFSGVRPDLLPYVVDRASSKEGRFMPGSRIPIVPETRLAADRPDYILILPWNLREEVTAQLSYAREWGARFVTAVPELTVD